VIGIAIGVAGPPSRRARRGGGGGGDGPARGLGGARLLDGELARLRFAESRLGHWLDVTGDTVVHIAVLAGIARRVARTAAPRGGRCWRRCSWCLGAFATISWSDASEARRGRVAGWENRLLDRVLSPLTTRDWHVFPVLSRSPDVSTSWCRPPRSGRICSG